jgi:tetratricopeptide (TPR) repeat protein
LTGDTPSLQEVLRQRQRHDFVGRDARLAEFGANLALPPSDPDRRFIVNLHGVAGVGKTFLAQQYRRLAESSGAVCAYADEDCFDVVETMAAIAADFDRQQVRMPGFEAQLATYRQRRHEMESDPKAPLGDLVTSTTVRMGMSMAKTVPIAGMAAEAIDPDAVAAQLNRLRAYLGQRFSKKADIDLLLTPVEVLTRAFAAGINDLAEDRQVVLFFDTFERTAPFLEDWLLDLFSGKFGNLSTNLVTTIGGQHPLSSSRWVPLRSLIAVHPLEPFTEEEARSFLARRGVTDTQVVKVILGLSGRVPMWLATLADSNPQDSGSVPDPSEGAVQRFLKWEPDLQRRAIARLGALPRRFNHDILATAVGGGDDVEALFGWLCRLPFVSRTTDHWRYHDAVRDPMLRLARTTSPKQWREAHQRLAEYFAGERAALGIADDDGWADSVWQGLLIEEHYHRLCAAPTTALTPALEHAARSSEEGVSLSRRWSVMMTAAGDATGSEPLAAWGRRLTALLQGEDADDIGFLTELIERADLAPEQRVAAIASRGESYRRKQQFDLALADLDRVLASPAGTAAEAHLRRWRAFALRDLERFEEALADFGRDIELRPDNARSWACRAETLRLMGRYEDALLDIDRSVELDPASDWAIAERGAIHRALGAHEEALADFTRAIELDPANVWYRYQRGYTYEELERYEEALADFERALELEPANDWYIAQRGYALYRLHRYEEALADFTRAIELDPAYTWYWFQRGLIYMALRRFDEAMADLDRAIELDPAYQYAFAQRAELHRELTDFAAAMADLDRAIELDPEYTWAYFQRGLTNQALGRYEVSLTDLTRAVELDSDPSGALAQRGYAYLMLHRFAEALADLDQAIESDPDYEWAIALRGYVHLRDGDFAEAMADIDRAVELDRSSGWNRFLRGCVMRCEGRLDQSRQEVLAAVELESAAREDEPDEAMHAFNLIVCRIVLEQHMEAQALFDTAIDPAPADPVLIEFLEDLDFARSLPGIDTTLVTEFAERARAGLRKPKEPTDPSVPPPGSGA